MTIVKMLSPDFIIENGISNSKYILWLDVYGRTLKDPVIPAYSSCKRIIYNQTIMNFLFSYLICTIIQSHGGAIDKFIGDAILAVWGIPLHISNASQKPVNAVLEMRESIHQINRKLKERGLCDPSIGIGINSGPVFAASIGNSEALRIWNVKSPVQNSIAA